MRGRMGMPMQGREMKFVVEGDTDVIGRMAGEIGALEGVEIKSIFMKDYTVRFENMSAV